MHMIPGSRIALVIQSGLNGDRQTAGYATATPGLVVVQLHDEPEPTWSLTHVRSGVNLGRFFSSPEAAAAAAAALGTVDWTLPGDALRATVDAPWCYEVQEGHGGFHLSTSAAVRLGDLNPAVGW